VGGGEFYIKESFEFSVSPQSSVYLITTTDIYYEYNFSDASLQINILINSKRRVSEEMTYFSYL